MKIKHTEIPQNTTLDKFAQKFDRDWDEFRDEWAKKLISEIEEKIGLKLTVLEKEEIMRPKTTAEINERLVDLKIDPKKSQTNLELEIKLIERNSSLFTYDQAESKQFSGGLASLIKDYKQKLDELNEKQKTEIHEKIVTDVENKNERINVISAKLHHTITKVDELINRQGISTAVPPKPGVEEPPTTPTATAA